MASDRRCEWLQCLVRIAILKYVLSKQISEVSRAVEHMFTSKVEALLGSSSSFDANDFRLANCYSEATDAVLVEYFESLKVIIQGRSYLLLPDARPLMPSADVRLLDRVVAGALRDIFARRGCRLRESAAGDSPFVWRVDAADERPRFH